MAPSKRGRCKSDNDETQLVQEVAVASQEEPNALHDDLVRPSQTKKAARLDSTAIGRKASKRGTTKKELGLPQVLPSFPSIQWMNDASKVASMFENTRAENRGSNSHQNRQWPRSVSNPELSHETCPSDGQNPPPIRRSNLMRSLALSDSLFTLDASQEGNETPISSF